MPAGLIVALAILVAGLVALARADRNRWWLAVAGAGALYGLIGVARFGLRPEIVSGPVTATEAITACIWAALVWSDAVGLPRPLAQRLGIGMGSRQLRFHLALRDAYGVCVKAIDRANVDPSKFEWALRRIERQVARVRRMHPPDEQWGSMRDQLADSMSAKLFWYRAGEPDQGLTEADALQTAAIERWAAMTDAAAVAQQRLATPSWRKRRAFLWPFAAAAPLVVVGVEFLVRGQGFPDGLADLSALAATAVLLFGLAGVANAVRTVLAR